MTLSLLIALAPVSLAWDQTLDADEYNALSTGTPLSFGYALAFGDMNCDQKEDLLVGFPRNHDDRGAAGIYFGHSTGAGFSGSSLILLQSGVSSPEVDDYFGSAVAVGDFNNDNCADIAVAAPNEDWTSAGTFDSGMVHTWLSSSYGPAPGPSLTPATFGDSHEDNGHFGYAMASGDFDGDGYDDLAVGSHGMETVYVIYGSLNGLDVTRTQKFDQADLSVGIVEPYDFFGSVLVVGNFDGDAYDDLAAAAPEERIGSGPLYAGHVSLVYGSEDGLDEDRTQTLDYGDIGTPAHLTFFGLSMAVGDFDGLHGDDLAICADGADVDEGELGVFFSDGDGIDSDGDVVSSPLTNTADRFCSAIAAGDLDGDGDDDLAVSVFKYDWPEDYAGLVVTYINNAGSFSTSSAILATDVDDGGAEAHERVGWSLAIGDIPGGDKDIAVGAPGVYGGDGRVLVHEGL